MKNSNSNNSKIGNFQLPIHTNDTFRNTGIFQNKKKKKQRTKKIPRVEVKRVKKRGKMVGSLSGGFMQLPMTREKKKQENLLARTGLDPFSRSSRSEGGL